jgi:SAM-dependent methyltransferase
MKKFIFRLTRAYRRHGPKDFIRLSGLNVRHYIGALFRSTHERTKADDFDRVYGTETAEIREIGSLEIQSANSRAAVRYQPSSERSIRDLIERAKAGLDISDFTFIDFGSGKGRVLIVAAQYSFGEVIGVEFSPELNEIAAANISQLPREITNSNRIRLVCTDAVMFEPPRSHLVCYFYNPFGETVMAQVAKRLAAHNRDKGFRVIVIYVDPEHLDKFQLTGSFTTLAETEHGAILTTNNARAEV